MEAQGKVNRYVCTTCGSVHGTINMNTGTTPFMIGCKNENCKGIAQSQGYNLPSGKLGCGWAWYRPTPGEFRRLSHSEQEHFIRGGLILGEFGQVVPIIESDDDYEFIQEHWPTYVAVLYKPDDPELFESLRDDT